MEELDPELAELIPSTNIAHIEAAMMSFRADISHPRDEAKMAAWEMRVYEFSRQFNRETANESLVEMLVLGSEIVDHEMGAEAEKTVPYFVMGSSNGWREMENILQIDILDPFHDPLSPL
jgi:hypothetical protein